MYEIILHKPDGTTKQISRADTWNINKEETKKIIGNHRTKIADRITMEKEQWRYRASRNQKIKWP